MSPKIRPERISLERELQDAGRKLSSATLRFHRAVASRLGLNDTDHKCLDILLREGSMTAGALAERGGYTTGAVTGIVNRLSAKGLAARVADPADRRRVVIQADADETHRRMWPLLQPMILQMAELNTSYDDAQLALIRGYLHSCEQILVQEASATETSPAK